MVEAVLFDLGNTLVRYWERPAFPGILREAITEVASYLDGRGLLRVSPDVMWQRVQEQDHGLPDHRVYPLEERLACIFDLDEEAKGGAQMSAVCRRFMGPMFARGALYADTLPTLEALRARGFKTAIVSNTPWGSPAVLWREEIARLGLRASVDMDVFCSDVGWRKPARQIFEHTLHGLQLDPQQCLFVGDDPRWDLVGPRGLGMAAVLIDRTGVTHGGEDGAIRDLDELWERLT